MVRAEDASYPLWAVPRDDALWISLCSECANHYGHNAHSGLEDDHRLGGDNLVTWRDATGHIHRRWAHVRTRRIALSTEGTETAGGVHDVAHRPQSRNSFEAGKRSVISTPRLCLFPVRRK